MDFMGLPGFGEPSPSSQMFGELDVSRNGAHTGGIAADLRQPATAPERASAPGAAALTNQWVIIGALVVAFLAINARDRKG